MIATSAAHGDWLDRLFDRAPLPAWGLGLAFAALVLALVGLAAALFEEPSRLAAAGGLLGNRDLRLGLTLTAIAGYLPAARHYLLRAARQTTAALRRSFPEVEPAPAIALSGRFDWLHWLFIALIPLAGLAIDRDPGLYFRRGYWGVAQVWAWALAFWLGYSSGRFASATLDVSAQLSGLARAPRSVDLLDRAWLAPFASHGLFSALLWLVVPAIFAVNLVDDPFVAVVPAIAAQCLLFGGLALALPTRGVRKRLAEAKQRELAAVHAALSGDDAALDDSLLAGRLERPGVADLVAWARYVADLSTSPFTQEARLRFFLYLGLPLGSWLGGALVDWLVEHLLT